MESKNGKTDQGIVKKRPSPRRGLLHLPAALSAAALLGLLFRMLWNQVGGPFLNVPELSYWQALGAMMLSGLLLRLSMFSGGRHRKYRSNHLAVAGCPHAGGRCGNGTHDI